MELAGVFKWDWLALLAGGIAIFAGCLAPSHWLPRLPNDKLLHFLAFGGLTLLARRITTADLEWTCWVAGLFFAGLLIEGLQHWIPGRRFCWRDLLANTAGITTVVLCSSNALFGH